MIRLVSPRFDEFEHALRGVDGRYLLHSRSCMDWSLHILELGPATAMFGRNGASSMPGCRRATSSMPGALPARTGCRSRSTRPRFAAGSTTTASGWTRACWVSTVGGSTAARHRG